MPKKGGVVHATQYARTDKKGKMIAVLYIYMFSFECQQKVNAKLDQKKNISRESTINAMSRVIGQSLLRRHMGPHPLLQVFNQ